MVASIARLLFIAWFALLAALLAWGAQSGWPWGAWLGLYVLVLGHPTLLAIELAAARIVSRRAQAGAPGPAPLPVGAMRLLRAWLREWLVSTIVFGVRLPWRAQAWPDHLPRSSRGLRGVVFVHGFLCNRGMWNPWLKRLTRLERAFVAVDLEPVHSDIDAYAELVERAVRRIEAVTGLAPVIVAHSMGGLAVRAWLRTRAGRAESHGHEHAARVITIGTPHHGSRVARLSRAANAVQMRVGSEWLAALARQDGADHGALFTCWWSDCDQLVYPPSTAVLADSESRQLRGVGHLAMCGREEIWEEIRRRIGR
ncbi:MAG TPA: permease [Burkholderiaceae bacterium]